MVVWDQSTVETLTAMWAEGASAREIAEAIPSATRSAIIGKAHRLLLGQHKNGKRGVVAAKVAAALKPKRKRCNWRKPVKNETPPTAPPRPMVAEVVDDEATGPVEYLKMEQHHCRSLYDQRGSDGLRMVCGKTRVRKQPGSDVFVSSYCPRHDRLYQPGRYTVPTNRVTQWPRQQR